MRCLPYMFLLKKIDLSYYAFVLLITLIVLLNHNARAQTLPVDMPSTDVLLPKIAETMPSYLKPLHIEMVSVEPI
jgi:hypothetical protein